MNNQQERRARSAWAWARRAGVGSLDEEIAALRAKWAWQGPTEETKSRELFTEALIMGLRRSANGDATNAAKAFDDASSFASKLSSAPAQIYARDLLAKARASAAPSKSYQEAFVSQVKTLEVKAAEGNTPAAIQAEMDLREALQWAEEGDLFSYAIGALPGGHTVAKTGREAASQVASAAKSWAPSIGKAFGGLMLLVAVVWVVNRR